MLRLRGCWPRGDRRTAESWSETLSLSPIRFCPDLAAVPINNLWQIARPIPVPRTIVAMQSLKRVEYLFCIVRFNANAAIDTHRSHNLFLLLRANMYACP